jgi:hypothetical protein
MLSIFFKKQKEGKMLLSDDEIHWILIQRGLTNLHPHYRRNCHHHQQGTLVVLIVTRTNFAIVQQQVEKKQPQVEHNQDGNDVDIR